MKMDPKQVHMAPFGLIFIQDGSHKLWEASGMPPGPQNAPGKSKNPGFPRFSVFSYIFLSSLNSNRPANVGFLGRVSPRGLKKLKS